MFVVHQCTSIGHACAINTGKETVHGENPVLCVHFNVLASQSIKAVLLRNSNASAANEQPGWSVLTVHNADGNIAWITHDESGFLWGLLILNE